MLGHGLGDALVGLMRHHQFDLLQPDLVMSQCLADHLGHFLHSRSEDPAVAHLGELLALGQHLWRDALRHRTRARRLDPQILGVTPIGMQVHRQNASVQTVLFRWPQKHRSGPIAKQAGYVPALGGNIQTRGVHLGTHKQYAAIGTTTNPGISYAQPVKKTRTLVADVQSRHPGQIQLGLHETSRPRKGMIRGQGRHDDAIDLGQRHASTLTGLPGGLGPQIATATVLAHPATLTNARAVDDPVVGRVHPLAQVVVGHHPLRQTAAQPQKRSPDQGVHMSKLVTSRAFCSMNSRRGST